MKLKIEIVDPFIVLSFEELEQEEMSIEKIQFILKDIVKTKKKENWRLNRVLISVSTKLKNNYAVKGFIWDLYVELEDKMYDLYPHFQLNKSLKK